jgi:N-dimethylarginine dimethylaminohydrolase
MLNQTPSNFAVPAYVMNFPLTLDNREVNNILMEDAAGQAVNYTIAFSQWVALYRYVVSKGVVYLIPSQGDFQDQTYVANVGCYLPHNGQILLSRFTSLPRQGEEKIACPFFESLGYKVLEPPCDFEGEADLKHLRDNIYVMGYGIRTHPVLHAHLRELGAQVISVSMTDPYMYHFDCMLLRLTPYKVLFATEGVDCKTLREIEKVAEVVSVPKEYLHFGWTNCFVHDKLIAYTPPTPEVGTAFSKFVEQIGYEPVLINLSEFERKSGAGISCLIMHL